MSIKSTHWITRKTARQILAMKILTATDKEMESMLEEFPESHFRNYIIVEKKRDLAERDQDRIIKSPSDF